MKIEHLALNTEDPVALVKWYCKNMDFTTIKGMNTSPFAHFIIDSSQTMLLEIFRLPDKEVPDYRSVDSVIMHLGFSVGDIEVEYQKLLSAGAIEVEKVTILKNGDQVAMLRDPWGLSIQLVNRQKVMV